MSGHGTSKLIKMRGESLVEMVNFLTSKSDQRILFAQVKNKIQQ